MHNCIVLLLLYIICKSNIKILIHVFILYVYGMQCLIFIIIPLFELLKWICNVLYIYTFRNANSKPYNCNIV